ncbi:hypothetical protein ACGF7U_25740 [Micromonospora sp. NPDC047670]|uniref:hypothetical protein n=1 Tax=Micromonospora sp. NPDC047670 TaxID=3364252 RepID=UPI00371851DB
MTSQRAFKARVRARMDKTGESYTTARRQLLARSADVPTGQEPTGSTGQEPTGSAEPAAPDGTGPAAVPPAGAVEAGTAPAGDATATGTGRQTERVSDALVRERTGRGWDEWFVLLDAWGATGRTHAEIARWLVDTHGVAGWWAQSLTVGYEQARGLRAPGQRRGGGFSAAGSRTVAVPVQRLFDAFADDALRRRWLPDAAVRVRTATAPRTFRADWGDGSTRLVVGFVAVDATKSRVSVQHERLSGAEQAAELKAYWRDRLAALKHLLEDPATDTPLRRTDG